MGAYLSAPVTDKESVEGENETFVFGACAMQGWRTDMEDAHVVVLDVHKDENSGDHPPTGLFGVFDGHGGKEVALFAASHMASELVDSGAYQAGDLGTALVRAFLRIDKVLVKEEHRGELKVLRGADEDGASKGGDSDGGMTINSSQLPETLLEALGMPGERGYVLKFVKAANGRMQIDDIIDEERGQGQDEEDDADDTADDAAPESSLIVVPVEAPEPSSSGSAAAGIARPTGAEASGSGARQASNGGPFAAAAGAAFPARDAGGNGKRKRSEAGPMQVDVDGGGGSKPEAAADEDGGPAQGEEEEVVEVEELSAPRGEDDYAGPSAGCTAVCALVRGELLVVANAGDSRCVLSRAGRAVALTQDHKPMDSEEYARIIKAGAFVADGRVNGSLNLSRALGDLEYKQAKDLPPEAQAVTAYPEIRQETLQEGDEFLILACDGIWDVLSNQEAVDFVRERLAAGRLPREVCEDACDRCLAPDTSGCGKGCDNMSFVLVLLKQFRGLQLAGKAGLGAATRE